jgi:hypothetical protein
VQNAFFRVKEYQTTRNETGRLRNHLEMEEISYENLPKNHTPSKGLALLVGQLTHALHLT